MPEPFRYQRKIISDDVVVWEVAGDPSLEEWREFLEVARVWLSEQEFRGKSWGVVVDPSRLESVHADLRRAAGEWRAAHMPLIANTCICGSYVATSAMMRGAITAVLWLAAPVIPVSVRASQDEAHQWVLTKLSEALSA